MSTESSKRSQRTQRPQTKPISPPVSDALASEANAGVVDELQAWYVARADADGWVYTTVVRQLLNRMYRERDYLARRKQQGQRTAYDYAVERDQKALAWAVRALVEYVPPADKARPEPPKKSRPPRRRLSPEERERYKGTPSWNGQPKRGWAGIELPPGK